MRTTMDAAGRVVLPKSLRLEIGMLPGDIEIEVDGNALRISVPTAELVEVDGLLLLPKTGETMTDEDVRRLRFADQR